MAPGSKSYEEWLEQLSAMYNMDGSIIEGYFQWLGQMLRGEFGDSWKWTVPVIEKFNDYRLAFVRNGTDFIRT